MFNIKIVKKKKKKKSSTDDGKQWKCWEHDLKIISQIQWLVEPSPNTYSHRKTNLDLWIVELLELKNASIFFLAYNCLL